MNIKKFEVGKVYNDPYDREWVCKVVARDENTIQVLIKRRASRSWGLTRDSVVLSLEKRCLGGQPFESAHACGWLFWSVI